MKILIASDIHGSAYFAEKVVERFKKEQAELLVLLGDIYNHGPRNPFPTQYDPMKVSQILNAMKDKMIVVKGNCDSEVDTLISEFDFINELCLTESGKKILCTHGHNYNKDKMPKTKFDAVIYGHFHTGFIEKIDGVTVANAGSVSLPKNGTLSSYLVLENGALTLKDIDGNVLLEQAI